MNKKIKKNYIVAYALNNFSIKIQHHELIEKTRKEAIAEVKARMIAESSAGQDSYARIWTEDGQHVCRIYQKKNMKAPRVSYCH